MGNSVAPARRHRGERFRKWLAGTGVAVLVGSGLVTVGATLAQADVLAPEVTATVTNQPVIAGTAANLEVRLSNGGSTGTDIVGEYNLSVGLTLPVGVSIADAGGLGVPTRSYTAGQTVRGGGPDTCAVLGLEAHPTSVADCRVPAGRQYFVFENISDLPEQAANTVSVSLLPDAALFDVGAEIPFIVSAFTSNDARLLPAIPGGTTRGQNTTASSGAGADSGAIEIEALQIEKSVDQPENELLRGVHENHATYTLTVRHTGEGDVTGARVVDYLPAELEYLGSGQIDNTSNANGNDGEAEEYAGSGSIARGTAPEHYVPASSVTTVRLSDAEASAAGLGENAGGVYTRVEWDLGALLASDGVAQTLPAAGAPGEFTIQYRAAVPLFENTVDFAGGTPASDGEQTANLGNNNGPSTRQGQAGDPWRGGSARNIAIASGEYTLKDASADPRVVETSASDGEVVEILDVRLLKSVENGTFEQGDIARYTLNVKASEYVDANLADADGDVTRPNRLVDDMGDGVCPIFPEWVPVTGGGDPAFVIGDPASDVAQRDFTRAQWNTELGVVGVDCAFPNTSGDADFSATPAGSTLTGIAYNPDNGHFYLDFAIADLGANEEVSLSYTAAQNSNYSAVTGGTSSGDTVYNDAEILVTTNPTGATAGVANSAGTGVGEEMRTYDESTATLRAEHSNLTKHVLPRSAGEVAASAIAGGSLPWETDEAPEPFMAGDEVWYRIVLDPPARADVRNPKLTDMLPAGVELEAGELTEGENYVIVPTGSLNGVGDLCATPAGGWTEQTWLDRFVGAPVVQGGSITWNLGSAQCVSENTSDRFLPADAQLTIYIKAIVVSASDNDSQDLTQNLVKYQEQRRDGRDGVREIEFMRDSAGISIVEPPSLVKGVETNAFEGMTRPSGFTGGQGSYPAGTSDNGFGSDVDGEYVVQGDEVAFRIDVTAPVSAPNAVGSSTGYVIWDALPVGMTKADLTGASSGVTVENGAEGAALADIGFIAYDPGDPGRPSDLRNAYANRTIVVWTVGDTIQNSVSASDDADAIERGFSLKYTVAIPEGSDGAVLQQRYVNTASITQYEGGADTNIILTPLGDNTVHDFGTSAPGHPVSSETTVDSSDVQLPSASVQKRLHATEVGPGSTAGPDGTVGENDLDPVNTQTRFAQGELLTYEYSVHIPAHTTVRNGVLSDNGTLTRSGSSRNYTVVGDPVLLKDGAAATLPEDFSLNAQGRLQFPSSYATGDSGETFSVRLTVLANSSGYAHSTSANIVNTARFTSTTATGGAATTLTDAANTQFVAPSLGITKTAAHEGDVVASGTEIEYTIVLRNANSRSASYDNEIVDTVPAGLLVNVEDLEDRYPGIDLGSTANRQSLIDGEGGTITWPTSSVAGLTRITGGQNVTVSYFAEIDPRVGGSQSFTNNVAAEGYTLPATIDGESTEQRRGTLTTRDDATVTAVGSALGKGVKIASATGDYSDSVSAPIGETVAYEVTTTLYADINYYDARITDRLPAGVSLVGDSVQILLDGVDATDEWTQGTGADDELQWQYTGDHILAVADADRTLTLRYEALLANTVGQNVNALPNIAEFSWGSAPNTAESDRSSTSDDATVSVLNPVLAIEKTVDGRPSAQRNPDATLSYEVRVTNTGDTPAHHVVVNDCVPAGIVVDAGTISDGGSLAPATADCGGGVITWELDGPLAQGAANSLVLSYEAGFAPSDELRSDAAGLGDALTNVADVTSFESFERADPDEPRGRVYTPGQPDHQPRVSDDAAAQPLFPNVTLAKTVNNGADGTGELAYAGESFGWKLTLVNTGPGNAQTVDVIDALPKNWSFDDGSALIKIGNAAPVALENPAETTGTGANDGKTVLTWNLGEDLPGAPAILGSAAQGNAALRTIEITFTATPQEGALGDAGVGMTVPHTNTLSARATDTTGSSGNGSTPSYVGDDDTANGYIASADLTIEKAGAAEPITAGSTGTGVVAWTIEVSNDGPDAAVGPIRVTDVTSALPAGVVVTDVSGDGWICEAPSRDADTGETSFECARENAVESLDADGSFPLINVSVTVAADQPAVGAGVITNTATVVPGKTHETDTTNNESSDDITIDTVADLTIAKTIATAPTNVGEAIVWQIQAWNAGPSVSRSTVDDPITITDTVPAGVSGVTAPGNADWVPSLEDGSPLPAEGVGAGTVIVWTYQGAEMPVGPNGTAPVVLSGTVLTSHVGEIANTAVVDPGPTSEGDDELENSSTVRTTPTAETSLEINKERVMPDGAGWRSVTEDDVFQAGTDIHYRVTVTNGGPADARDVVVVDEVPAGLGYENHANISGGTWARTSGGTTSTGSNGAWDGFSLDAALPAGSTSQFVVTYGTAPTVPASFINCVEATAENWLADASEQFDRGCNDSASVRVVDLGIEKTHVGDSPFVSGTSVDYAITVTNHGPSASAGPIVVTDALPQGMSYVAGTATTQVAGGAAVSTEPVLSGADDRMLTWNVPLAEGATFDPGETVVVTLTAYIDEAVAAGGTLTNTATASGPENEPTGEGTHPNTTTDEVTTGTSADMTIVKTADGETQVAGTDVTYTLSVTNHGPSAVAASVTDALPAGLSFVSMSGDGWECAEVDGVPTGSCDYSGNDGLHPVGDARTSTITVVARIASNVPPTETGAAGLLNTAELSWSDSYGSYTDDDEAAIRISTEADLGIVKSVVSGAGGDALEGADAQAIAGGTVWYRLAVGNYGPSDAVAPIAVTDVLPEGITVPTDLVSAGAWDVSAGAVDPSTNRQTVVFTLNSAVAAGTATAAVQAPVIEFEANVAPTVADASSLVNEAAVSSETPDSNPANDHDTAEVIVTRSADLSITKSHPADDNGQVRIDQPLDFTIQVTNNGPSVATGIIVTDTVPRGLEVTSVAGEVLDGDGAATGWTIVSIDPVDPEDPAGGAVVVASYSGELGITADDNAANPLVIQTVPRESAVGADPNHVSVTGDEFDPELENNEFEDPIDVLPRVTLITTKTAVGDFQVGKVGEYRITVSNEGPHADPGPITVRDALPAGLSFDSSPDLPLGVDFAHEGGVATWVIRDGLAVGEAIEFRLLVDVEQAAYPTVVNTVVVDSPAEKTSESVLEDTAIVSVAEADRVAETGSRIAGIVALGALLLIAGMAVAAARRRKAA